MIIKSDTETSRSIVTTFVGELPDEERLVAFAETINSCTRTKMLTVELCPEKSVSKSDVEQMSRYNQAQESALKAMALGEDLGSSGFSDGTQCEKYREGITVESALACIGMDNESCLSSDWVIGLRSMRNLRKNLGDDISLGVVLNPYTLVTSDPNWAKTYELFKYDKTEQTFWDIHGKRIDCIIQGTLDKGGLSSKVYDLEAVKHFFIREDITILDEVEIVATAKSPQYTDRYKVLCWEYNAPVAVCDSIFKQSRESGLFSVQDIVIERLGLSRFKHKGINR